MTVTKKKKNSKIIERHLRNYGTYKAGIKNMQKQLDYIMPNITANYELKEHSIGAFVFNSTTENYAIDRIESKRALQLHEDITSFQIIVESVDESFKVLEEQEKQFVEIRYFQNRSMEQTAQTLNYTSSAIYALRNQVLDKLNISLKSISSMSV